MFKNCEKTFSTQIKSLTDNFKKVSQRSFFKFYKMFYPGCGPSIFSRIILSWFPSKIVDAFLFLMLLMEEANEHVSLIFSKGYNIFRLK